jgi:hypothetical protein
MRGFGPRPLVDDHPLFLAWGSGVACQQELERYPSTRVAATDFGTRFYFRLNMFKNSAAYCSFSFCQHIDGEARFRALLFWILGGAGVVTGWDISSP